MTEAAKLKSDAAPDLDALDALRDDIDSLKFNIATLARQIGGDVAGKTANMADKAAGNGNRLYHRLAEEGERMAKVATHEVEEHPLSSVLIAFALGFVGGKFLSR